MDHLDVAHAAAIVGAVGTALVLLLRGRAGLTSGFALLTAAQVGLASSLVPGDDLRRLVEPSSRIALVVLLVLVLAGLAIVFARSPAVVPLAMLVAAPFRVPVTIGNQEASLLVPLYAVVAAAVLALLLRAWRGAELPEISRLLAIPAVAFIGLSALSLLWSGDPRAGAIELLFFLFPFAALVAVVARAPVATWLPKALAVAVVALACGFAAIGISQLWSGDLYFARDLEVSNAYTSYLRTTSLFADSSIYGRQLVVALVVLVTALWLARLSLWAGVGLIAFLWVGLYLSYSQSSMVALVVAVLAVSFVAADRLNRRVLLIGSLVVVLAAGAIVATSVRGDSAQRFTSARSTLIRSTWRVFAGSPVAGVGIGAQPKSSKEEGGRRSKERNASHTTPLTVAAELGVLGLIAYVAFLAGGARLLLQAYRQDRAFGLGLGSALLVLVVQSLFYSGFFEDPLMWGILAVASAVVVAARAPARAQEPVRPHSPSVGAGEPTTAP
jgi:O-Antigen ligase